MLEGESNDLYPISKLIRGLGPQCHLLVDQCCSLQDTEGILTIGSIWVKAGAFNGEQSRRTLEMAGYTRLHGRLHSRSMFHTQASTGSFFGVRLALIIKNSMLDFPPFPALPITVPAPAIELPHSDIAESSSPQTVRFVPSRGNYSSHIQLYSPAGECPSPPAPPQTNNIHHRPPHIPLNKTARPLPPNTDSPSAHSSAVSIRVVHLPPIPLCTRNHKTHTAYTPPPPPRRRSTHSSRPPPFPPNPSR